MSKFLTVALAALFAAVTVTPVAVAQDKKDVAKKEMKKGEGKKTDGKAKSEAMKTDGKAKSEAMKTDGKAKSGEKAAGKKKGEEKKK
jgi:pentapeptide MXKDX repeat protein